MTRLTLADANLIAATALAEAARLGLAQFAVAVLDPGEQTLAAMRREDSGTLRLAIATAKAAGCLGLGFGGREIARRAAAMPALYAAFGALGSAGLVAVPGGVLIRDASGTIIGAAGCSGDTADRDEACILAGIAATTLTADTGA